MLDVNQFVMNLRVNLLRKCPFYGHVLMQLPVVISETEVPTLGVGKSNANEIMVKLFINPKYVEHVIDLCHRDENRVVDHFTEVLRHEVHHLVFSHLTLDLSDKRRQEIACELSDNSYVDRSKLVPEEPGGKAGVFPEDFGLESKLGVHEYYALLNDNKKFKEMQKQENDLRNAIREAIEQALEKKQKLDELAERQEQEAKENEGKSGKSRESEERQRGISSETQEMLDGKGKGGKSKNGKGRQSDDGKGNGSEDGGQQQGSDMERHLQNARDLQEQAEQELGKGNRQAASEKQRQAADELRQASDSMSGGNGNGNGNGDGEGSVKVTIDSHGKWKSVEGDEMTNEMVKDIVRQANETCKQMNEWGNVPGEVKQAIEDAYADKKEIIPWEVVLKDFLASSSENVLGYTMKRRSKRYDTRPGTKKDDVLSVAIGIDTSGSVDNDMLQMFFNELHWIDKTGTRITVFEWDTQVNREYDFRDFDGEITGRGGTDPTDFLETVSQRKFDCVITFTDLCFDKVKEHYNIPMLWVVDNQYDSYFDRDELPVDDGIIMRVNADRDGFEVVRR